MIDVALIGTGGMIPLKDRFLSSMMLRYNGSKILVDCGEGTQVSIKELGWGFKNLDFILFTHFHADHISGLPGLLLTLGNSGREEPVTIVGPKGISYVVKSLRVIAPELPFEIEFLELSEKICSFKLSDIEITALKMNHGIACYGYSFYLPRAGKFDMEKAQNVPKKFWSKLQKGETISEDGKTYTSDMVLSGERKGIKVSYITDTLPINTIPEFIHGSDLFICEGLYGDDEMLAKAESHNHMIFSQAAKLAGRGSVKELWLTHYTQAMKNPADYIDFAKNIFENSYAGYDRMSKTIMFDE